MEPVPTAIVDACVLYSAPVRDLLVRPAQAGVFHARWTADIHDEWIRNVLKNNPRLTRPRLERTRSLMDAAVRDCLVTGYADLIDSLTLPDADDRHVLAAAIRAGASLILTFNLKDFPPGDLAPHGVTARHPGALLADLLDAFPDEFLKAIRLQREALKDPPMSAEDLLARLETAGLARTATRLRQRG
ncbi:hypothetical protein OJF2_02230 [Aquisphaera giovannonii]|uniref:Uncharacterized protein n=1 Tax=Aquisphaera giovannonii TaxID=406548 RepID=A0A5B9VU48_9BACT|nr:PIN domain-containing protein [Aquisphaera giovannonii]QEH31758.1 hypothetical protein OJF2_02230 [Aquisphaera giovannonii]